MKRKSVAIIATMLGVLSAAPAEAARMTCSSTDFRELGPTLRAKDLDGLVPFLTARLRSDLREWVALSFGFDEGVDVAKIRGSLPANLLVDAEVWQLESGGCELQIYAVSAGMLKTVPIEGRPVSFALVFGSAGFENFILGKDRKSGEWSFIGREVALQVEGTLVSASCPAIVFSVHGYAYGRAGQDWVRVTRLVDSRRRRVVLQPREVCLEEQVETKK